MAKAAACGRQPRVSEARGRGARGRGARRRPMAPSWRLKKAAWPPSSWHSQFDSCARDAGRGAFCRRIRGRRRQTRALERSRRAFCWIFPLRCFNACRRQSYRYTSPGGGQPLMRTKVKLKKAKTPQRHGTQLTLLSSEAGGGLSRQMWPQPVGHSRLPATNHARMHSAWPPWPQPWFHECSPRTGSWQTLHLARAGLFCELDAPPPPTVTVVDL